MSNQGGFHSNEEAFTAATTWYSPLLPLLHAALQRIGADYSHEAAITGWINASAPSAFNSLHDHGTSIWSMVYFVDDGGCAAQEDAELWGCLLLRTQLVPFTHKYAFMAARPRPGDLWLFPGYLSHAVLPRQLKEHGEGSGSLRVSVACNLAPC